MRKILFGLLLLIVSTTGVAQGKLVRQEFVAASLQNNNGGEYPVRQLTVYLPPGYEQGTQRYPVIYVLHGYGGTDSIMMSVWINFKRLLDEAIKTGKMRPMIVVAPNSNTKLQGSFYTNSSVTGKWADYIGKDVVQYMDKNLRTIPDCKKPWTMRTFASNILLKNILVIMATCWMVLMGESSMNYSRFLINI